MTRVRGRASPLRPFAPRSARATGRLGLVQDEAATPDASALLSLRITAGRDEALTRPCPIPATPGVYAWYFDRAPAGVPTQDCHTTEAGTLLYVGISPKAPSKDGLRQSRQNLRTRIRYHYRGNAAGSTLRLSLGSLLVDELGIGLRRVGSGQRLTFSDGEARISEWMSAHTRVCWLPTDKPWEAESNLI